MGTIERVNIALHQVQPLTNERLRPSLGQLFTKKFGLDLLIILAAASAAN
jgi:hypothetical protein